MQKKKYRGEVLRIDYVAIYSEMLKLAAGLLPVAHTYKVQFSDRCAESHGVDSGPVQRSRIFFVTST